MSKQKTFWRRVRSVLRFLALRPTEQSDAYRPQSERDQAAAQRYTATAVATNQDIRNNAGML